ncbi:matrixin family metalloprotease [Streptomyces sp. NPDC060031]|uniref:matrixin family metalloprotease n=1 Tax=Streptomyces sp. NPDC060031 TaxID=3347043 RepID=UPI0036890FA4
MNRFFVALSAAASLLLLAPGPARAVDPAPCVKGESESKSRSSVDEGEIRYTDSSQYHAEIKHAIAAWQYSGAKIKIVGDTASTVNDLDFQDFNDAKSTAAGIWSYNAEPAWTDYIRFNKAKMSLYSAKKRRSVAAHELGHALGLCHKDFNTTHSLMWPQVQEDYDVPQAVDKANYKKLWG